MKTVGLIGGLSWHSTVVYYRRINEEVQRQLGGNHSAELVLHSFDFALIEQAQTEQRWADLGARLAHVARALVGGGAQGLAICANTMHKVAPFIQNAVDAPLISILDSTANALKRRGLSCAALLGTKTTMSELFYVEALARREIKAVVPSPTAQLRIHEMIHNEVIAGKIKPQSKSELVGMIEDMASRGAQAAILGCTELPLLVAAEDTKVPLIDTLEEHAQAIAAFALKD